MRPRRSEHTHENDASDRRRFWGERHRLAEDEEFSVAVELVKKKSRWIKAGGITRSNLQVVIHRTHA